jgi:hypothetical protein
VHRTDGIHAEQPTQDRRVLIIVENLPSPFDRRVWQEATTLHAHGYQVSTVCPTGKGYEAHYELIDGIHFNSQAPARIFVKIMKRGRSLCVD